jgi:branched-subunit amino acid permease
MSTALPIAALGLGWIGLVIVVLIIIFLITRVL